MPNVAIIGGGLSGISCAQRLKELKISSVVFDTGKHAPGGRCSSREIDFLDRTYLFDHSLQCLTSTTPAFDNILDTWAKMGIIRQWPHEKVIEINSNGIFTLRSESLPNLYTTTKSGNRGVIEELTKELIIKRPVWVSSAKLNKRKKWILRQYKKYLGEFDYIIIAHNGKCADRLMSKSGAKEIHKLLRVKFGSEPDGQQIMQLCSMWVLMVIFPKSLNINFEAAFISCHPDLSWIKNNTYLNTNGEQDLECWIIVSSREFGTKHKVPQEFILEKKEEEIKELLLSAMAMVLDRHLPEPLVARAQLWGAGNPMTVLNNDKGFVFDVRTRAGICGDWLISPNAEGAVLSGIKLADYVHDHINRRCYESVGINSKFKIYDSSAIGV